MSKEIKLEFLQHMASELENLYSRVSSWRSIEQMDYAADYLSDALSFIEKQINLQKMFEAEQQEPDEDVD